MSQIKAAMKALSELNIDIKVVGLVKDDHHRTKALLDHDNNESAYIKKETRLIRYGTENKKNRSRMASVIR
jgi:excinuclease ABC subunit C